MYGLWICIRLLFISRSMSRGSLSSDAEASALFCGVNIPYLELWLMHYQHCAKWLGSYSTQHSSNGSVSQIPMFGLNKESYQLTNILVFVVRLSLADVCYAVLEKWGFRGWVEDVPQTVLSFKLRWINLFILTFFWSCSCCCCCSPHLLPEVTCNWFQLHHYPFR